jgi:hypothetical protein
LWSQANMVHLVSLKANIAQLVTIESKLCAISHYWKQTLHILRQLEANMAK